MIQPSSGFDVRCDAQERDGRQCVATIAGFRCRDSVGMALEALGWTVDGERVLCAYHVIHGEPAPKSEK